MSHNNAADVKMKKKHKTHLKWSSESFSDCERAHVARPLRLCRKSAHCPSRGKRRVWFVWSKYRLQDFTLVRIDLILRFGEMPDLSAQLNLVQIGKWPVLLFLKSIWPFFHSSCNKQTLNFHLHWKSRQRYFAWTLPLRVLHWYWRRSHIASEGSVFCCPWSYCS